MGNRIRNGMMEQEQEHLHEKSKERTGTGPVQGKGRIEGGGKGGKEERCRNEKMN